MSTFQLEHFFEYIFSAFFSTLQFNYFFGCFFSTFFHFRDITTYFTYLGPNSDSWPLTLDSHTPLHQNPSHRFNTAKLLLGAKLDCHLRHHHHHPNPRHNCHLSSSSSSWLQVRCLHAATCDLPRLQRLFPAIATKSDGTAGLSSEGSEGGVVGNDLRLQLTDLSGYHR